MAGLGQLTRCIFNPSSGGTGTWTVSSAATGYLTPAGAGAVDQVTYCYAAELRNVSNVITDWEVGTGTYTVSGTTLSRTPIFSSNSNAAVNFATPPVVMITTIVDATNTYLLLGGAACINTTDGTFLGSPTNLMIAQDPSTATAVNLAGYGANAFAVTFAISRTRGTSHNANVALTQGDVVGEILFEGNDGSSFQDAAQITSFIPIGSTVSSGVLPAGLRFRTNNSTNFVSDSLVLTPSNDVITAPQGALATNATVGFLYVGSCAGIPTGTPSVSGLYAGNVPIVIDSTHRRIYGYVSSTWQNIIAGGLEVALTDGATPALDASLGTIFTLSAAGDRTIAVPSNPTNGQKIVIRHLASGAARTLSLNTSANGFRFGSDITALTQTASGKTDYIGCIWNVGASFWDVVAYTKGF